MFPVRVNFFIESGRHSSTMNCSTIEKSKRRREVIHQLIEKVDTLTSGAAGNNSINRSRNLKTASARLRAEKFDTDCTTSEKESSSFGPDSTEIKTLEVVFRGSTPVSIGTSKNIVPIKDLQELVKLKECEKIYAGQVKVTVPVEYRQCKTCR